MRDSLFYLLRRTSLVDEDEKQGKRTMEREGRTLDQAITETIRWGGLLLYFTEETVSPAVVYSK